jgi:hypothetical protein
VFLYDAGIDPEHDAAPTPAIQLKVAKLVTVYQE